MGAVEFEEELPPSWEALWRHWLRTCWVSHYWSQATQNQYNILKITDHGWKLNGDTLEIDCDSKENMEKIRDRVHHLLKGCGCKTGCNNKCCSCVKGTVVQDAHAVIARKPTSSDMGIEEEEEQEYNIVREEYRKLEEENFSDIEEQEEDTSDREKQEEDDDKEDSALASSGRGAKKSNSRMSQGQHLKSHKSWRVSTTASLV